MSGESKASRMIGLTVGLVVVVGAVYSVFFIEWDPQAPAEPDIVRPLKTMLIESPFAASARKYPGEVQANNEVALAFQVTGQLIEFPVKKDDPLALIRENVIGPSTYIAPSEGLPHRVEQAFSHDDDPHVQFVVVHRCWHDQIELLRSDLTHALPP